MTIKDGTRGPIKWAIKAAHVHLVERDEEDNPQPTDRPYWLIIARKVSDDGEGEIKYFVCNGGAGDSLQEMLQAAFARWHIEKWFERAKQEAGFGAFEVRNHTSLIRHWLCSRLAMLFLSEQTHRLRGEKSTDHVGASGRGGGDDGVEDMAAKLAILV
jgi:SRSO17 transposase